MSAKLLTLLSTYTLIVLCELGDKTQLAVLLISSNNPAKKWLIFLASALALAVCVLIEVTVGVTLAKYIGPAAINKATGLVFVIIGTVTLAQHFRILERLGFCSRAQIKKATTE